MDQLSPAQVNLDPALGKTPLYINTTTHTDVMDFVSCNFLLYFLFVFYVLKKKEKTH